MRLPPHVLIAVACLCAQLVGSSPVQAQTADAQPEGYRAITQAAVEEYGLGHWDEALALFGKAHEMEPNARTFWGLGIASFEARRYADAMRFSQSACDDKRKPLTDAQRKQAESVIRRASDFLVRVKLELEPVDALVSVDGSPVERDSHGLALLGAGPHQLVVSAPGHEEAVRSVQWSAGSTARLQLRLAPSAGQPGPRGLRVTGSDASPERDGALGKRHTTLQVAKWSALGLSVGALAVTGVGVAVRQSAATHWNDEGRCPEPKAESCPGQRDKANQWRVINVVTGAAAAALAAAAVTLFVLDRPARTSLQRALSSCTPELAPGLRLGLDCQLRF